MTDDPSQSDSSTGRKVLSPAAQRALAEAEARQKAAADQAKSLPKEFQGPKGPEPTRYGDWESKGIASIVNSAARTMMSANSRICGSKDLTS